MNDTLSPALGRLAATIAARKTASPEASYVAKLMSKGKKKIAQKLGEEGVEVALAMMQENKENIISESADLLFHLLVAWEYAGVTPGDVAEELARRDGVSGLKEKAARGARGEIKL